MVKKEAYPTEIMPCVSYKKELNIDKLLYRYCDLMVVRQVKGLPDDYMIKTENGDDVLSSSVFVSSMANLSLNLAGGIFDTSKDAHLRFLPLSEDAIAPWEGGKVNPEVVADQENYSITSPCFGLCFLVKKIHDRTFPFYKYFNKQEDRDEYAKKAQEATTDREKKYDAHLVGAFKDKKSGVSINPRIKVHHAPNNANYWHATLDTYRPTDQNPVAPNDMLDNSDRKMFKALKQDLLQNYSINELPNYRIRRCSYIKWQYLFSPLRAI